MDNDEWAIFSSDPKSFTSKGVKADASLEKSKFVCYIGPRQLH
jgi:hypothetical protein